MNLKTATRILGTGALILATLGAAVPADAHSVVTAGGKRAATVPVPPTQMDIDPAWAGLGPELIFPARTLQRAVGYAAPQILWATYHVWMWTPGKGYGTTPYAVQSVYAANVTGPSARLPGWRFAVPANVYFSVDVMYQWATAANAGLGYADVMYDAPVDYQCLLPSGDCNGAGLGGSWAVIIQP